MWRNSRSGRGVLLLCVLTLNACKQGRDVEPNPGVHQAAPRNPDSPLVLVEAELATQMQHGELAQDYFCEKDVPLIAISSHVVDANCGHARHRWAISEENVKGDIRSLRSKDGQVITLEAQGRMRYRISGHPCDPVARFYVEYPEAQGFRAQWLKTAHCPAEDMKLAH